MKNLLKSITLGLLLTITFASCERVQPNYQGVLMTDFGKNGKSDFHLQKGRVWTISPGTELFQVPLFIQRADFESKVALKTSDNTEIFAKPKYSYTAIEDRAVDLVFQNKQIDGGENFMKALEDNVLEPKIFDIIDELSKSYSTDSLMTTGGSLKFEKTAERIVKEELNTIGLKLENFALKLTFTNRVTDKIDSRNEVNTNLSVLDQKIEEQKKKNQLASLIAEENIILSRGITPQILDQLAIEKWDGKLNGTYAGSNLPFIKNVK